MENRNEEIIAAVGQAKRQGMDAIMARIEVSEKCDNRTPDENRVLDGAIVLWYATQGKAPV